MLNFLKKKSKLNTDQNQPVGHDTANLPAIDQIGVTAGELWGLLAENGPMEIERLTDRADSSREAILLAMGWLAREGKIHVAANCVSLESDEQNRAA